MCKSMSLLGLLLFSGPGSGLEACMAASSGKTAICLGASRAQNCLTASGKVTLCVPQSHGSSSPCLWLAYFSSRVVQPAHMQASQVIECSFSVLCRTQRIHPARHIISIIMASVGGTSGILLCCI